MSANLVFSNCLKLSIQRKFYIYPSKFCKINKGIYRTYSDVRVRFAPSPTGFLHLGGLRTALYNYLFAKSQGGRFILRIEDTDTTRTVPGSIQELQNDLRWLSLTPDESPEHEGAFGPYIQSYRSNIYKEFSDILLENHFAYKCFCSPERLKTLKDNHLSYDNKCRSLTPNEVKNFTTQGLSYCIRLKLHKEVTLINDLIHGSKELTLAENEGDTVIVKSNGMPTYHFANVIDDHLMKISHVLRGIEWLSSTPKHIQMYKCFGWEPPLFGHLPNISNFDGTKLSKRQKGLQIKELRNQGYSPISVLNFMKLYGGGFNDVEQEKLNTLEELISKFNIEKINLNPAPYDLERLKRYSFIEHQTKVKNPNDLKLMIEKLREYILLKHESLDVNLTDEYLRNVILWSKERIHKIEDLTSEEFNFLWAQPHNFKSEDFKNFKVDPRTILMDVQKHFEEVKDEDFTRERISEVISQIQRKHNIKTGPTMKLLRLVSSGLKVGPPVNEILFIIGRNTSLQRTKYSVNLL